MSIMVTYHGDNNPVYYAHKNVGVPYTRQIWAHRVSSMAHMLSQVSGDRSGKHLCGCVLRVVRGKGALGLGAIFSCDCSAPEWARAPSIQYLWHSTPGP